ncbi:hypothetical protein D3C73_1289850 [compost metagenome]
MGDRLHDPQARHFLHVDAHARVVGQIPGQQLRQVFGQRRRVAQQAYLTLLPLSVLAQVELQAFDLLADQPRMLKQRLASRGRLHTAAVAFQQRSTE